MNEQGLKALENLGAELGAAKAENERLRGLLEAALYYVPSNKTELRALIDAALEHSCKNCEGVQPESCMFARQAEPTDTFTAVDMATAAAQGFRDGQAAVEQAPAQDEREFNTSDSDLTELLNTAADMLKGVGGGMDLGIYFATVLERVEQRLATRPAQTEQQPVAWLRASDLERLAQPFVAGCAASLSKEPGDGWVAIYLDPLAQTAPQPEQSGLPDPRQWTDQQVLDFLGVALRNVDVVGTVQLNEIRQGFELVMGRAALSAQGQKP